MQIIYRCEFMFALFGVEIYRHTSSKKGIDVFREGFWINRECNFTQGSDAQYWIPPSKIRYISKDHVNK